MRPIQIWVRMCCAWVCREARPGSRLAKSPEEAEIQPFIEFRWFEWPVCETASERGEALGTWTEDRAMQKSQAVVEIVRTDASPGRDSIVVWLYHPEQNRFPGCFGCGWTSRDRAWKQTVAEVDKYPVAGKRAPVRDRPPERLRT